MSLFFSFLFFSSFCPSFCLAFLLFVPSLLYYLFFFRATFFLSFFLSFFCPCFLPQLGIFISLFFTFFILLLFSFNLLSLHYIFVRKYIWSLDYFSFFFISFFSSPFLYLNLHNNIELIILSPHKSKCSSKDVHSMNWVKESLTYDLNLDSLHT